MKSCTAWSHHKDVLNQHFASLPISNLAHIADVADVSMSSMWAKLIQELSRQTLNNEWQLSYLDENYTETPDVTIFASQANKLLRTRPRQTSRQAVKGIHFFCHHTETNVRELCLSVLVQEYIRALDIFVSNVPAVEIDKSLCHGCHDLFAPAYHMALNVFINGHLTLRMSQLRTQTIEG